MAVLADCKVIMSIDILITLKSNVQFLVMVFICYKI
jgi:hypothetical protein